MIWKEIISSWEFLSLHKNIWLRRKINSMMQRLLLILPSRDSSGYTLLQKCYINHGQWSSGYSSLSLISLMIYCHHCYCHPRFLAFPSINCSIRQFHHFGWRITKHKLAILIQTGSKLRRVIRNGSFRNSIGQFM